MRLVSHYGMTTFLVGLAMLGPIEAGDSSKCSPCLQEFYQEFQGVTLANNKPTYCQFQIKLLECLDSINCNPEEDLKEDPIQAIIVLAVRVSLKIHCGYSTECAHCFKTYNEEIKGVLWHESKPKYCSVSRKFLDCTRNENCKSNKQGSQFRMVFNNVRGTLSFMCGDLCLECLETYTREFEAATDAVNETDQCSFTKKFLECSELAECNIREGDALFRYRLAKAWMDVKFLCGYSSQCAECQVTLSREENGLKTSDEDAKWCSVYKKFLKCSEENKCNPHEQGYSFQLNSNFAHEEVSSICAPERCDSQAATKCMRTLDETRNQITANMLIERAECTIKTKYFNCLYDNGCLSDWRHRMTFDKIKKVDKEYHCYEKKCDLKGLKKCERGVRNRVGPMVMKGLKTKWALCYIGRGINKCIDAYDCRRQKSQAGHIKYIQTLAIRCPIITEESKPTGDTSLCYASWLAIFMAAIVTHRFY